MSEHPTITANGERAEPTAVIPAKRIRKRRTEITLDAEAKAIGETYAALKPLGEDLAALDRVIDYVRRRFGFPG